MALTPRQDLERVGARDVTPKEDQLADYALKFDGSFRALQVQTERQYRVVSEKWMDGENYLRVEVLDTE